MDVYEATRIVFSRIQNLDPENANKIMGLLLIQDHGEKEMIRLAFGPESLVHSVIVKARKELGLSSNTPSTPSTPSSPSPFLPNNHPLSLSRQNSSSSSVSSRLLVAGGGGFGGVNLPSPLSIPNPSSSSSSWSGACFSDFHHQNREELVSPSSTSNGIGNLPVGSTSSSSMMNSSAPPFYGSSATDLIDEFQLQDQLSFLNDGSPSLGPKSLDLFYPQPDLASSPNGSDAMLFSYGGGAANGLQHRRSCSVSDIYVGSDDPTGGFGWKPCLYFARGYCKNGTSCRFLHGNLGGGGDSPVAMVGSDGGAAVVGSPGKLEMMEQCQELLRSKSFQQQRLASQLMAYSPNKCMNFLLQQQQTDGQRAAAALMMGEDVHKFGRTRLDRSDFSMNGGSGMVNPGSRQIYLTFPADSTFREEDVSNYFSIYGPVQDVRIPYQQKRMFGFVTFVYPETVKLILAKGNPHFVCDARVLVKPYKEKGKVPDKYRKQQQHQQLDRGDFTSCGSPTGLDSRDPFDLQLGARMFYNSEDMWRRKLVEQADLQQAAIELQGRRLMGLQLLDVKKHNHHRTLSTGAAISSPSPTHSPNFFNHALVLPSDRFVPEVLEENGSNPGNGNVNAEKEKELLNCNDENGNGNGKESPHNEEIDFPESLEHNLPDSPFASPKASDVYMTAFSNAAIESEKNSAVSATSSVNNNLIPSTLDMASFKSCYFQAPRFSSGHGAIEM